MATTTVDEREVAKFDALAREWWDPKGKLRPLHKLNPVRLAIIREQISEHFGRDPRTARALTGLRVLDIGCGGGLLAEPLARQGAAVIGADASARNIEVARLHAAQSGLDIDYRATTAEELAAAGERFDVVLALEIVEHVASVEDFVAACGQMVKPGGLLFVATINRTAKAFALAIVGAEYVLRWLPRGTHRYDRLVRPDELAAAIARAGLAVKETLGVAYAPLTDEWRVSSDTDVNYMVIAARPSDASPPG
jgi:2-polyprenyl-6-hydroxyphenyl methylase/3-demethylubiquinone-9 3-methyltransferase